MKRLRAWIAIQVLEARWGWRCGHGDYSTRDEVHAELDRLHAIRRGER